LRKTDFCVEREDLPMRAWKVTSVALSLIFSIFMSQAQETPKPISPPTGSLHGGQINPSFGNQPVMFEANQGQIDPQVKFLSRGSGYSAFLTAGGMVLTLRASETISLADAPAVPARGAKPSRISQVRQMERAARETKSTVLSIDLMGAAANPAIVGEEALPTKVNYFIGRDPNKWRRNVPTYGRIRYRNVYPGIDLVYYGNDRSMEYDFDLAPGADPSQIQFDVKGADALNLDSTGNLVLTKGASELRFQTPALYQQINGVRTRVPGTYTLHGATQVGFEVGNYDPTKPLVIDPVLVYSTYLGGTGDDFSNGIAVDSLGNAYVVGITDSPNFPLAGIGIYNSTQFRMFLTKFNSTGSTLLFADYFGGTSADDEAYGIALDSAGDAYVTGSTTSSDFPVMNAYQSTLAGSQDAFLTKFAADGSSIVYSTYLGGSNLTDLGGTTTQIGNSVSVDPSGEAVIAGVTAATNFPMNAAYQSSVSADQFGDWGVYGFLTKFAADGGSLVYSTYVGGSTLNVSSCAGCFPDSEPLSVATDASGNAYIAGLTTTTDFPVTSGAFSPTFPGSGMSDVGFVSKFNSSGGIAYSTYLGGLTASFLNAIAVDSIGSAYVTGYDIAGDSFPIVTTSICDPSAANCNGTVVAKLDPTGSSLLYSTFLGTSNNMVGQAIQVDASGDAFIVGSDLQFDLANPIEGYAGNGDVVVAEISPSASSLMMATFLGGQQWEAASGLALDANGAVYVTGVTQSPDFPVTQSAIQTAWGGQTDVFVTKIDPNTAAPAVAMGPWSLQFGSENVGSTSASQTTVLRNMGSVALTISAKSIGADFAETDDCGTIVAAASFCTFTVTFAPTASGNLIEALTITDDATGSPHIMTLSGTGVGGPAPFFASPSNVTFSSSPLGTASKPFSVRVTNASSATLSITGARATGDFSAVSNNCSSMPVNGTCTVQVSFTPTQAGIRTGTLRLISSGTVSSQVVALTGSGIDFKTVVTNPSATVASGGTATYQLTLSSIGGTFSNPVSFACGELPAHAVCTATPQSIIPGGNASTVSVTVQTAETERTNASSGTRNRSLALWIFAPTSLFGVLLLGRGDYRRRIARHAVLAIALIAFGSLVGCGGTPQSSVASNTTPPGTYSLNVVATSGALQHVTKLTLIVQ
jgi:hypothetical protein